MTISCFDLFSIGIGPSSSHTVGPMRAASIFLKEINQVFNKVAAVEVEIYGSLAWTGEGHGTRGALLLGLEGHLPESIDPTIILSRVESITKEEKLLLSGQKKVSFPASAFIFNKKTLLPKHSNGMRFSAKDEQGQTLAEHYYYSVGGGFVMAATDFEPPETTAAEVDVAYPFDNGEELLRICQENQLTIAEVMRANERSWRDDAAISAGLKALWQVMAGSIEAGCQQQGILPGKLKVKRRAASIYQKLKAHQGDNRQSGQDMNWLSVYAIAVNEENAAGGRVVTAPTNGAAGIIPAVLRYTLERSDKPESEVVETFLLTAAAIGALYKKNASISAAEVGCQGEVGVACSMAAGAIAAVLNGTVQQIENAAEIGMEHHLGLTCDPIAGLVQIPCIERNAMGAVQAVNAANLALLEDGSNKVSLDEVIHTMWQTGRDMCTNYKETSQAGLAVNVPEC